MKGTLTSWIQRVQSNDILLGYGSLMSADSRKRHSAIVHEGIPVTVQHFARGWVTRAYHEQQTYVGAWPEQQASLNAQLVPVTFNPGLQQREQDYQFESVSFSQLVFDSVQVSESDLAQLKSKQFWICHTLDIVPADGEYPVNASYLATCLQGCLEAGGASEVERFINTTQYWPDWISDDLDQPLYPRAACLSHDDKAHCRKVIEKLMSRSAPQHAHRSDS
ncbi:gamma-glutamylcyclotransferase [Alteromonas sediminis]|uniref:Gamma-glutamylcyclotransferase n=2 Tax=Alteromonas sediminis TaxID=2259342 RepID=A0A3N5Z6D4_9ALTE|nr:gamma-glutamylcyclotransferase [Alteromonas sediminis]